MLKKQNGITLIALLITIIVLLILAGVSISLVVGENGVLNKATTAKEETVVGEEKEKVLLAATAAKVDTLGGEILEENFARELTNIIGVRNEDYLLEKEGEVFKVTYLENGEKGNHYYVDPEGKFLQKGAWVETNSNGELSISNGIMNVQIGDYVYYDHITGATNTSYTSLEEKNGRVDQTFTLENCYPTDGKWQVVGVNNDGELLIAVETYLEGFRINNFTGYENIIEEMDNISSLFGQGYGATSARSMTIEDINKITRYNPEVAKYADGELNAYGNEIKISWSGNEYPNYSSKNGNDTFSRSHTNGFFWYNNGTQKSEFSENQDIVTLKNNYYEYYPETLTETYDDENIGLTYGSKTYNTFFEYPYSLASRYHYFTEHKGYYGVFCVREGCSDAPTVHGYNIVDSSNSNIAYYVYIRPVVSLKSDIKLTGSSEEGWTIVK